MGPAQIGKLAAYVLAALLGAALLAGLFMPSRVDIAASVLVTAPPRSIYPLIADFKRGWPRWNAFDDGDPDIVYAYPGPDSGPGAIQRWHSRRMGDGEMRLTRADTAAGVDFTLAMGQGGKGFRLDGSLALAPEGAGTRVTWTDRADLGKNPAKRLMGPLMSRMMRQSMEKSLAGIKRLAEAAPAPAAPAASAAASPLSPKAP
jgi:hypothetical protein